MCNAYLIFHSFLMPLGLSYAMTHASKVTFRVIKKKKWVYAKNFLHPTYPDHVYVTSAGRYKNFNYKTLKNTSRANKMLLKYDENFDVMASSENALESSFPPNKITSSQQYFLHSLLLISSLHSLLLNLELTKHSVKLIPEILSELLSEIYIGFLEISQLMYGTEDILHFIETNIFYCKFLPKMPNYFPVILF